jgi:hypothetical protein
VLRTYDDYSNPVVSLNRDFISTSTYLRKHERLRYNSFIFGSSRTVAFRPESWKRFLPDTARPFMFDASGETITGMRDKIRFLDSTDGQIDNALLIICRDATFADNPFSKGFLFEKHPATSHGSWLEFHMWFVRAFLDPTFLSVYFRYLRTQEIVPQAQGYLENRKVSYDTITNHITLLSQDEEMKMDPKAYHEKRRAVFHDRPMVAVTDSVSWITARYAGYLREMKAIFDKHHTQYRIVISPLYERISFNRADLALLTSIFGDRVHDFSGKNAFTDDPYNYYESSHFIPAVGDSIMARIYTHQP